MIYDAPNAPTSAFRRLGGRPAFSVLARNK